MKIYKTGYFEASHQLENHSKCGTLHGHSYKWEVWLYGDQVGEWGFVSDFHDIKEYFDQFDHNSLSVSCEDFVKSSCRYLANPNNIYKVKVRIWETTTSYAEDIYEKSNS
jgi:6-pyruvoyltetrahydropterin/6-carboxytetrahydropterin synthase